MRKRFGDKDGNNLSLPSIVGLVLCGVVIGNMWNGFFLASSQIESGTSLTQLNDAIQAKQIAVNPDRNAADMKTWRKQLVERCSRATTKEQVEAIGLANKGPMKANPFPPAQPRDDGALARCKHMLLDFGANIGDTSGKLMDAGFVGCNRQSDLGVAVPEPNYSMDDKVWVNPKLNRRGEAQRNPLTSQFVNLMKTFGPLVGPEDYCYYGVEGNPVFTERLRKHEDHIMAMQPRPISHMHFFTESVGAGKDGMTKLFLDTVNTKENFWGSSIMSDHQDVRRSAEGGEKKAAPVMGYTIGTLLRKTTKAFDPSATPEEKKGGHFILKGM